MKSLSVKAVFIGVLESPNPTDCRNCGGAGVMSMFLATEGPYNSPAAPYSGKSSHWYDGKWWVGNTITAPCPVCEKEIPPQNEISPNKIATSGIKNLTKKMSASQERFDLMQEKRPDIYSSNED